MALADIPKGEQSRRLDSWKEIAEYLRRDVRTATRWESQGLPLHRVAGGKGRSVFAFTHEIDTWMASRPAEPQAEVVSIEPPPALPVPTAPAHPRRTIVISIACAVVVIAIGAVVMSMGSRTPAFELRPEITPTDTHISITDALGASRVIYESNPGAALLQGPATRLEDIDADGAPEVLAAFNYASTNRRSGESGELLNLSTAGQLQWRFGFDDVVGFAGSSVSGPWTVTDWQAEPDASMKRIAIAAHEERWWASLVAVLDHTGRRLGPTFVNPGWIESVMWRSADRLAIAGFNNKRDEGMLAILDASDLAGQAPGNAGTEYACRTCSTTPPLFYATFPRSEVNVVTAGRFNRGRLSTAGDRLEVHTVEAVRDVGGDATAVYEFDHQMRFVRARYSDIYWSEHQRLELEGRLTHTREQCPQRDGPPAIKVWEAASGWVRATPSDGR